MGEAFKTAATCIGPRSTGLSNTIECRISCYPPRQVHSAVPKEVVAAE